MIFQTATLTVRTITEQDVALVSKWLQDSDVLAYYEGRDNPQSEEMVREKLLPRQSDPCIACVVEYERTPIGYIQFYQIEPEERAVYGYDSDEIIYGMDQFIGETAYWNRGVGTELVRAMCAYLTDTREASKVVMDPQAWNARALRCYEKCGFRKVKWLPGREWHEGSKRDCWLMEYSKENQHVRQGGLLG